MNNEIKVRTSECNNCNKFSHCNNNDLVCIKKFRLLEQQLLDEQAKNKKLVKALDEIVKWWWGKDEEHQENPENIEQIMYHIAWQALNEVNNG